MFPRITSCHDAVDSSFPQWLPRRSLFDISTISYSFPSPSLFRNKLPFEHTFQLSTLNPMPHNTDDHAGVAVGSQSSGNANVEFVEEMATRLRNYMKRHSDTEASPIFSIERRAITGLCKLKCERPSTYEEEYQLAVSPGPFGRWGRFGE